MNIGDGIDLPINAAIARYVIIAKSGAGKTNGDCVLIENFVRVGVPTIVFDPLGNMYGLRSSADGEGAGLPMAIFGGAHGDVPLPLEKALYIADLLAEGVSAVLDLSFLDLEESVEFARTFIPRYQQRLQGNAHVVFEEADRFTPNAVGYKNPINTFARTSRNSGIGWTCSTQRPQILSKAVIDSASVFIAMRMTGSLAQDAIGGEIGSRIGKKLAASMIAALPHFARGEAWFIPEPDFLGDDQPEMEPRRFRFRLRETFDVRPPRVGEIKREPKVLADVDLERLRTALSAELADESDDDRDAVIERLRARIAELEATPTTVEVPVLRDGEMAEAKALVGKLDDTASTIATVAATLAEAIARARIPRTSCPTVWTRCKKKAEQLQRGDAVTSRQRPDPATGTTQFRSGARRMLQACAQFPKRGVTKPQIVALAKVKAGGTFSTYLGEIERAGFVERRNGRFYATAAGIAYLGSDVPKVPQSVDQILDFWRGQFRDGARRMLDVVVAAHPQPVWRATVATKASVAQGGTFSTYLGELKRAELVTEDDSGIRLAIGDLLKGGR